MAETIKTIRRALISVSDKTGLEEFARFLAGNDVEIVATSSTHKFLSDAGIKARAIDTYTGLPEMMDGRLRTLHPKVHGGLLARRGKDDAEAKKHDIEMIDLLVVNLYPFEETVARADATLELAIENIDIGGPAMLRAAAKNHKDLIVVCSASDYGAVQTALQSGGVSPEMRRELALKVFRRVSAYDAAIGAYLGRHVDKPASATKDMPPDMFAPKLRQATELSYGENAHQKAAFYVDENETQTRQATQLQGKTLSYNNMADADAAFACVSEFTAPACAIIKHATPCGVACGGTLEEAYVRAFDADSTSAFGGVIAFNNEVDEHTAAAIIKRQFVEVVIAPAVADAALKQFATKEKIKVLQSAPVSNEISWHFKSLNSGFHGFLVQTVDAGGINRKECEVVTKRKPDENEWRDLEFAWGVVRHVRSNAIVFVSDLRTVGIGGGQTNRVGSVKIAATAKEEFSANCKPVMASDAFFPFRDGVDAAATAGVTAIIQPGGSVNDKDIIAVADEHKMAMVLTHQRRFKH